MRSSRLLDRVSCIKRGAILFSVGVLTCLLPRSASTASGEWNARPEFSTLDHELAASPYASGTYRPQQKSDARVVVQERLLMGFEHYADGEELVPRRTANVKLFASSDYGVTQGRQCARVVTTRKNAYAEFVFPDAMLKNWQEFDFLAMDIHVEGMRRFPLHLEFRDAGSRDYYSRCTLTQSVKPGSQTLLFPISILRRNGKEGLHESELRPEDVIPHSALREVKMFFETGKGDAITFWLDRVRLLNRSALHTPMPLELPAATALALNFGARDTLQPGFEFCTDAGDEHANPAFKIASTTGIVQSSGSWPDGLSGSYVYADQSGVMRFTAPLPNGNYRALLLAGPLIRSAPRQNRYLLKLNNRMLVDALPDAGEIDSQSYLHRFLWTAYSERKDALFLDYIERMYPVYETDLEVHDGTLLVAAKNFFVSALVVIPENHSEDAGRFAAKLRKARAMAFERQTQWPFKRISESSTPTSGEATLDVFVPGPGRRPHPKLKATASERETGLIRKVVGPGQSVFARFCLRPDAELGMVNIQLSDALGKRASIRRNDATLYFSNYRYSPDFIEEGGCLPTDRIYLEPQVTQTCHLWWRIANATPPGTYVANIDILLHGSTLKRIPIEIVVSALPMPETAQGAFGFYYQARTHPMSAPSQAYETFLGAFACMKQLGFTSVTLPGVAHVADIDVNTGKISMRFDDTSIRAAGDAGLGRQAHQPLLLNQLNVARAIARRLPGMEDARVDRQPGIELKHPLFRPLWMSAMEQYRDYLAKHKGFYVFEVIDEPREHPNPWNRNFEDTMTYGKWMGELGLKRFVTLMGDGNGGRDYTGLVDVVDVVSVHLNDNARGLRKRALASGKTLWFFNAGLDRNSWGFSSWKRGATGRFEWHWCWPGDPANNTGGYPGDDWHNPFTRVHGLVPNAPKGEMAGGLLLNSALFDAADGLIDYTFIRALEDLLKKDGLWTRVAHSKALAQLNEIRDAVSDGEARPDAWRGAISMSAEALGATP